MIMTRNAAELAVVAMLCKAAAVITTVTKLVVPTQMMLSAAVFITQWQYMLFSNELGLYIK